MEGSFSHLNDEAISSQETFSELLANLPSRGFFSSTIISPTQVGMRVYVCDKDTSPPDDQIITTNQENILIRSLTLKKKGYSSIKDEAEGSRKRVAEKSVDSRTSTKRNCSINSPQDGSTSQTSRDLQRLTVERLRSFLKAKGLSPKGKKDELIARLKGSNG